MDRKRHKYLLGFVFFLRELRVLRGFIGACDGYVRSLGGRMTLAMMRRLREGLGILAVVLIREVA